VQRGGKVTVENGQQVQALEGGPQDGQIGHNFDAQQAGFVGVHSGSLPTYPFPENHPEHERTVGLSCSGSLFGRGDSGGVQSRSPQLRYALTSGGT
jgi:hypothetical protein